MRYLLFTSLLLFTLTAPAANLNDFSVLLPLPSAEEAAFMVSPLTEADKGSLLPRPVFDKLPDLVPENTPDDIYKNLLRVIGIRLDPCFAEGEGPQACRRQIRLVWQPILILNDHTTTRDAAVHTFYDFDEKEWELLLSKWPVSKANNLNEALQIHPRIKNEGLAGPTWKKMRDLLLEFCGEKNLTRATAMNVMNGEQVWAFAGFDVKNSQITSVMIPRIERSIQGVIMGAGNIREFSGTMRPAPAQDLELEALLNDSVGMRQGNNEKEIKALVSRIFEYENPRLNNPGTLDCVSCHVAQNVRLWAQVHFRSWNWSRDFAAEKFVSPWNLENQSAQLPQTNNFRAFGYFQNRPAISQRVINETSVVAESLKK